jgi:hypothetical protein
MKVNKNKVNLKKHVVTYNSDLKLILTALNIAHNSYFVKAWWSSGPVFIYDIHTGH